MVDSQYQHTGTGSRIITEIILYLKNQIIIKYDWVLIKIIPKAMDLEKNGFLPVDTQKYIIMERNL